MSFITVTFTITQTATPSPTAAVPSSTFITPDGRRSIIALSIVTGVLILLCVVVYIFNRKMKKELQRQGGSTQHERETRWIHQDIAPSPYDYYYRTLPVLPPTFRKGQSESTTLRIPNQLGPLPSTKTIRGPNQNPIVTNILQPSKFRDLDHRGAAPNVLLVAHPNREMRKPLNPVRF